MAKQQSSTPETVAKNLKRLMEIWNWSQVKLAAESGVSQTHISAILRGDSSCTVETADALAKPFNLMGWRLMVPNLPDDLINSPSLDKLVDTYIGATADGRDFLDAAAEREAKRQGPPAP